MTTYWYVNKQGQKVNYVGTQTAADAYAKSQGWVSVPSTSSKTSDQVMAESQKVLEKAKSVSAQTAAQGSKPYAGSSYEIPAERLNTPAEFTLPKEETDMISFSGIASSANSAVDSYIKNMKDLMASYTANAPQPTDMSSIYESLAEEYGIEEKQAVVDEKQAAVNTATNELNNIKAQIQAVTDEENAALLQLEKNAATGADITSTFLGRQQAEISRNAAIRALPLQSQALVASAKVSAAQGDQALAQDQLEQAGKKLDKVFDIRRDYEKEKYTYSQNLIDKVMAFATDAQKTLLQDAQKKEDRVYQEYQDKLSDQKAIAKQAMAEGDYASAAKITALDPKSATYAEDLAALQEGIRVAEEEVKTTIANVNGRSVLINSQTGETIKDLGIANSEISGGTGGTGDQSLVNAIIANPSMYYTITPTQRAAVLAQLQSMGYDVTQLKSQTFAKAEASAQAAFNSASNQLDVIASQASKVIIATNAWETISQQAKGVSGVERFYPDIKVFNDSVSAFTSMLARAVGEKGVLTDYDIARIKKALPNLNDTVDTAQQKLTTFRALLESIKNGTADAYTAANMGLTIKQESQNSPITKVEGSDDDPLGLRK